MQTFLAADMVTEAFLELVGRGTAAGIDLAAFFQPSLGEADDHAPEQAQHQSRIRVAHPTVILGQGYIERVMQAALDDPVAPLESEEPRRIQLFERKAADQINDLRGFLTLTPHPALEPCDGLSPRKTRLRRRRLLAVQHADFGPAAIVFPRHRMGARRGPRGKNAVR